MTYRQFLHLLGDEDNFREFFRESLAKSSFRAFRFETPPISPVLLDRDFEYILLNAQHLAGITPDTYSFREHWKRARGRSSVFKNLGGSSTLIAPVPLKTD